MTPKEATIAALSRAYEEAAREDWNPAALQALLTDALKKAEAIEETKRPRRVRTEKPNGPVANLLEPWKEPGA